MSNETIDAIENTISGKHVFLVTSGAHSDYAVDKIRSSIESAAKWISEQREGSYKNEHDVAVEVWEIDGEKVGDALGTFSVVIDLNTGEFVPGSEEERWGFDINKKPNRYLRTEPLPDNVYLQRITSHENMRHAKREALGWYQNHLKRMERGLGVWVPAPTSLCPSEVTVR
ncbi:MAG: hypothetical protein EON58_17400 [Alphaproteobacteria bacterium]|nr:MAG: hypothetical protein EON58_17400 [Alphaproteobacteria bacterium]